MDNSVARPSTFLLEIHYLSPHKLLRERRHGWDGDFTELLASVANPEFAREAANEWCTAGEGLDSLCGDSRDSGDSDSGSSSSDGVASGGEEDDEDDDCSEPFDPLPIFDDDGEHLDGEGYAAAAHTFSNEMHSAAAPEAPKIFVPPKSLYVKRKRTPKGVNLPTCRPPSEVGAIEAALRASVSKKTAQIFYPTPGLVFDS